MSITVLRRVDASCNMARFYEVSTQLTLFGEVSVRRYWGRIGTRGQVREAWLDPADAPGTAERLIAQKLRRGYVSPLPCR